MLVRNRSNFMPTDAEIMSRLAALGHGLRAAARHAGRRVHPVAARGRPRLSRRADLRGKRPPFSDRVYGADVDLETARRGGLLCGLSLLANLRQALDGDLGRVRQVVMVRGFVTCAPGLADYPKVINACSELFIALWGEPGRHARTSIGVAQLPMNATVEIDAGVRGGVRTRPVIPALSRDRLMQAGAACRQAARTWRAMPAQGRDDGHMALDINISLYLLSSPW